MESLHRSSQSDKAPEDDLNRLVGEVAKRHKIVLSPNDPLFVVLTVLELVVGQYLEKADMLLQSQRDASVATMERAAAAAKTTGEHLITAAADYVAKQSRSAISELTVALTSAAAAERVRVDQSAKSARRIILIGSCVMLAVTSVAVGVAVGTWLAPGTSLPTVRCPTYVSPGANRDVDRLTRGN